MAPTQDEEMLVMTRNATLGPATVSRVMMVSPLQNEMLRRNRSRVFISVANESVIDSILFQAYRPIEDFIPAACRAIQMAGLHDPTGEITLQAAFDHNPAAGFMQNHLVSRGWLENDQNEVCDVVIEVELQHERLPDVNMKTYDAVTQSENTLENPLCIFCDIQDLYPQEGGDEDQDNGQEFASANNNQTAEAPQSQDTNGGPQHEPEVADRTSQRGRVTDPSKDMRLKENRDRATAMARQSQGGDADAGRSNETAPQGSTARMAGKPGRVARPWDGRLKQNRAPAAANAGGR